MRTIIVLATTVLASAAAAVPALAATRAVRVGDDWFISKARNHKTLAAKAGDTITWRWAGDAPHNVTVSRGPVKFHSRTQTRGTYSKKLRKKGTYKLYCSIHGARAQSMTLKIS